MSYYLLIIIFVILKPQFQEWPQPFHKAFMKLSDTGKNKCHLQQWLTINFFNLQCDWQNKESIHAKLNILLWFLGGYSLRAPYISTLPIEYNTGPVLQCM